MNGNYLDALFFREDVTNNQKNATEGEITIVKDVSNTRGSVLLTTRAHSLQSTELMTLFGYSGSNFEHNS